VGRIAVVPASRSFISTLTSGWRFTLPIVLREARGWVEGTHLIATAKGQVMILTELDGDNGSENPALPSSSQTDASSELAFTAVSPDIQAECYLGAGGKIIVPASLRKTLRWIPGKRLTVSYEDAITVRPCCAEIRCRACGSTDNVREVLPNVFVCNDCWGKYMTGVRQAERARTQSAYAPRTSKRRAW